MDGHPIVGRTLSHYKILAKIGAGGMGEVFLAEDCDLHRRVALKIVPTVLASNHIRCDRFEREARAVAALNHPNIVTIYSIDKADGIRFLTMELCESCGLQSEYMASLQLQLGRVFNGDDALSVWNITR
jgi:eukaryotic-like serine/threonine-protein kinase